MKTTHWLLGCWLLGTLGILHAQPPLQPVEPPAEVAADPRRLAQFDLAQLRQGRALAMREQKRTLSAVHLHLQAAVAFQQAGLTAAADRELSVGMRLAMPLQVTLPPMERTNILAEYGVTSDQTRLWRCHHNGLFEIWELPRGELVASFYVRNEQQPQNWDVRQIAVTPDGRRAIVQKPKGIEIWDLDQRNIVRKFAPKEFLFSGQRLSPEGKTLAFWQPGFLSLVSLERSDDATEIAFHDHTDRLAASFSSAGDRLLVGRYSHDRNRAEVFVYDVQQRKEIFRLENAQSPVVQQTRTNFDVDRVAWSPRPDEIAIPTSRDGSGELLLVNVKTKETVRSFSQPGMLQFVWDPQPDGLRLLTWGRHHSSPVTVWDVESGEKIVQLDDSRNPWLVAVLERPFRAYRYLVSSGAGVRLYEPNGRAYPFWERFQQLTAVAQDPASRLIAIGSRDTTSIFTSDSPFEKHICEMPGMTEARFLHQGQTLLTAARSDSHSCNAPISLWNLAQSESSRPLHVFAHGSAVVGTSISPDGRQLIAWGGTKIRVWDLTARQLLKTLDAPQPITGGQSLAGSVATWDEAGELSLWNLDDGTRQSVATGGRQRRMIVAADQSSILAWNDDFEVRWFDLKRPEAAAASYEHPRELVGGVLDERQSRSLTWSLDGTLILWDLRGNKELGRWKSPTAVEQAAIVDEPALRVVSRSTNGSLALWEPGKAEAIESCTPGQADCSRLESLLAQHHPRPDGRPSVIVRRTGDAAELVDPQRGKVLGKLIHGMTVYGDTTGPDDHSLLRDGRRWLTWSRNGTAILWTLGGIRLQVFDHRQATSPEPPAPGDSSRRHVIAPGTFFVRLLDDDRRLVTADGSDQIALWSVAPPLPDSPQAALLELETRSKLKVDAFGNTVWLTPEELNRKSEQLKKPHAGSSS